VSAPEFVIIGRLGRTRGTHGELWVTPDTDFPERFLKLTEIYVKNRDVWECLKIISVSMISDKPVVKLEGISTPEEAARFTNRQLAVLGSDIVAPPENSYYWFDLIGCQVVEENTGRLIGEIVEVETYPANDVYVVKNTEGIELLLPAVRSFVKEIAIEDKKIVIDTAGLIDVKQEPPE